MMITDNEKKALLLAKKVFEHFTHEALSIAREIIDMENDLHQDLENAVTIPLLQPGAAFMPEATAVLTMENTIMPKPASETASIRVAGPLGYARVQTAEKVAEKVYEESPY